MDVYLVLTLMTILIAIPGVAVSVWQLIKWNRERKAELMQLKEMMTKVNSFGSIESYLRWLARLSNEDLAVWAAWPTAEYFVRGVIEEEQRKRHIPDRDRKRPSQDHTEPWIYAERQHGSYPDDTEHSGKWMVFPHVTEVDSIWFTIADAVEQGKLGSAAKVATSSMSRDPERQDDRVICVYTYDSEDKADLLRILQQLRSIGVHYRAMYKEDRETHAGNYAGFNIISRQQTTRSPVKYYTRPGQVELRVPKSRS